MQRSLHFPPREQPRLRGYVPVLQDKSGELDALRSLAATRPEVLDALTPALHIVGPKRGHLRREVVKSRVRRIRNAVGTREVYLDFARADPTHCVELRGERLTLAQAAYHYARQYGLAAIPVIHTGASAVSVDAAIEAASADGRGLAIRHRLLGTTSSKGVPSAQVVSGLLDDCGLPADEVDLWLDLGFLDEEREVSPHRVARVIERFERIGQWRRIVLTGSSMPIGLGIVPEGTDRVLPRREWLLWNELSADLRQRIDFGDYAVQHPSPPSQGGAGMRANIRYTVGQGHLIVRGRGPFNVEGVAQYVGLCARVISSGSFAGSGYSWGDDIISKVADRRLPPGTQTMWRAAGTAHHLRVVTEQLQASA